MIYGFLGWDIPTSWWIISVLLGLLIAAFAAWVEKNNEYAAAIKKHSNELQELRAKIGRPSLVLSWFPLLYRDEYGEPISYEPEYRTEFVLECRGQAAFDVWMNPFTVGDFVIQGRAPIPQIQAGASARVEYVVRTVDGQSGLRYWGFLNQLLDDHLAKSGEDQITVAVRITYIDIHGDPWSSEIDMSYVPGVYQTPVFIPRPLAGSPHLPPARQFP